MWLISMFDLPMNNDKARREYVRFRTMLLNEGFFMLQYSVYARFCASEDIAKTHRSNIKKALPPDGEVRILTFTDAQFGKMQVFHGKARKDSEEPPKQLAFF